MRSFYITFLFFLTLGNAFAANYYEDAQSKYDFSPKDDDNNDREEDVHPTVACTTVCIE